MAKRQEIGLIGLAVMGANLARNIERHGFSMAVFNRRKQPRLKFAQRFAAGRNFVVADTLEQFIDSLERPRRIILMVKAGAAVDSVLGQLRNMLEPGDIVIDGGNSFFRDTERRMKECREEGIHFLGMGVSGGEEGALRGPCLMPGGEENAYRAVESLLHAIAAQTEDGPCCIYIGQRGSGHFVKMVHNGIEYGDMQLIAEAYHIARRLAGLSTAEIRALFEDWNRGPLRSFLVETAAKVVDFPDQLTSRPLVDMILDSAGQKGTGMWAVQTALEFGVPVPSISAAVNARLISAAKEERLAASRLYDIPFSGWENDRATFLERLRRAVYASKICCYAQGFVLLRKVSEREGYGVPLEGIARIWKGGCIIRAALLDRIRDAYGRDPNLPNLLVDRSLREELASLHEAWRTVVSTVVAAGLPVPAMSASLAYFDAYRTDRLPACLIQAQRDCFGAHTYQRIDRPGTFHTDWNREG